MKHLFVFLCCLVSANVLLAQDARLVVGCKKNMATANPVVQLKFMFPSTVVSPYAVNVFRKKTTGGNWEKINSMPLEKTAKISLDKVKASPKTGDEAYKEYQGFINHKPGSNPKVENNFLAFAGIMVLADNKFAEYAGCYIEDNNAENGATYQYRITDAKHADKELAVSEPFLVSLNYLPAIGDLTVRQKRDLAYLDWGRPKPFYKYKVYRKKNLSDAPLLITKNPIMLGVASGESVKDKSDIYKYVDTAATPGGKVYYQVSGIDVMNNESALSKEVLLEVRDMIPPAEVDNVKAVKKDKDAVLSWKPVAGKDCIGYNIYRSSTLDTVYKKINTALLPVATNTCTDHKLPEGTNYAYYIESVDAAGNNSKTPTYKVLFPDVTPPAKPLGLKGIATPGIIKLTWNKNAEGDMLGYFLYRASVKGDKAYFNLISKAPIKGNSFTDTLPGVAKNDFVYYIQAVDKHYNKSPNSDTIVVHLPDTLAPNAPHIIGIKYADKAVVLTWQKPADKDVVGYNVYRNGDSASGKYIKLNTVAINELVYNDKSITDSKTWYYYVNAVDDAGNSSKASNVMAIHIGADSTSLKAAENVRADFNKADSAVHVTWSNNSKNVHGYMIFRKEDGGSSFTPVSAMTTTTTFIDKNIEYGMSYEYMIRSYFTIENIFKNSEASKVKPVN